MKYIIPGNFDVVIMNPDFATCMIATRNSKYGDIVSLLPTTLLNIMVFLNLFVTNQIEVGTFNYLYDRYGSKKKSTPDSIWIFKKCYDVLHKQDKTNEELIRCDGCSHLTLSMVFT